MRWFLILVTLWTLQGCSSQPVVTPADRTLSPRQAAKTQPDPTAPPVQWGGVIIESQNLRETTEIQILAFPLDEDGRPNTDTTSIGRFIAVKPGYLELAEYAVGREVTATGKFSENRKGLVAGNNYLFPILTGNQITLWPESAPKRQPRIHFGFGASSGGGGFGSIGISF